MFCFRRSTRNIVEDYGFLLSQFLQASAMSVVIGLVYFNLGLDQSSMRDRFGMMYILGALYPYMIVLDLIGICKYFKTTLLSLSFKAYKNLYLSPSRLKQTI